jgi:putative transposase
VPLAAGYHESVHTLCRNRLGLRPPDQHVYVYLDGIWLKRSWGGEVRNIAVLVAAGVRSDGHRGILGVAEGTKEDAQSWRNFLRYLKGRGLKGVKLVISDKCLGLLEALGEFYPEACMVH